MLFDLITGPIGCELAVFTRPPTLSVEEGRAWASSRLRFAKDVNSESVDLHLGDLVAVNRVLIAGFFPYKVR